MGQRKFIDPSKPKFLPPEQKASLERLNYISANPTGMSLKEKRHNLSLNPQQQAQLKQTLSNNQAELNQVYLI